MCPITITTPFLLVNSSFLYDEHHNMYGILETWNLFIVFNKISHPFAFLTRDISCWKYKNTYISMQASMYYSLFILPNIWYLRNRKHFPCFHTVIGTLVEVWENGKLKFPRNFEFFQTSTCVSITYGNTGENIFYFIYKITRRKLKRGNSLLYRSVNSPPYCSWWREPFHVFHRLKGTRLLTNQSSRFQNLYYKKK